MPSPTPAKKEDMAPNHRRPSPAPDVSAALVVVAVGTDHHRFDRLVSWMDGWAARHPEVETIVQRGNVEPTSAAVSHRLLPHDELLELFTSASAIVTHGGPSTVMDARSSGRLPIVVPRDPDFGEHVDDHQMRFGRHLQLHGLAELVPHVDDLESALAAALATPDRYAVPALAEEAAGVLAFAQVVDELIGATNPATATGVPR